MSAVELHVWIPLLAAFGASALTGVAAFGVSAWQASRAEKDVLATQRRHAYSRLLAVTGNVVHSAHVLRLTQELRSGVGEGIDVALRVRKPLDPFELGQWMRNDLEPMYSAWSEVWTVGTPEAVTLGNRVVDLVGQIVGESTTKGEARHPVATWLLGAKWTEEQVEEWHDLVGLLASARRDLADLARRETGLEVANFLSGRAN